MGGSIGGNFGNTKGKRANAKIHNGRQNKHIEGTNNYRQQIAKGEKPSILTANPNTLLRESVGKGISHGANKRVVDFGRIVGKYYHSETGQYYETTRATIHYDSKGNAHIVPAKPRFLIKKRR